MKKIITRNIFILSLVSLFADIASDLLFPITPIFLGAIGYSALFIGTIEGIAEFIAGLSKGYFGELSDRVGKRAIFVRIGYTLSALSKPMLGLSNAPFTVLLSRSTDRLGKGMRTNARDAWLVDESHSSHRAKVFGFHRAMDTLGAVIGPLLALAFLSVYPKNFQALYLWAFVPGCLAALLTFIAREDHLVGGISHSKSSHPTQTSVRSHIQSPSTTFFSFLNFWPKSSSSFRRVCGLLLIFFAINSSDALLLLLAAKNLGDERLVLIAYVVYNFFFALLSYPMGSLADRYGMAKTFSTGLLFFAGAYFLMPQAKNFNEVIMAYVAYAIFCAATEGVSKAWISKLVHKNERATALGFFSAGQSICILFSSVWTGLLWKFTSAEVPFMLSASIALIVAVFLYLGGDGKILSESAQIITSESPKT